MWHCVQIIPGSDEGLNASSKFLVNVRVGRHSKCSMLLCSSRARFQVLSFKQSKFTTLYNSAAQNICFSTTFNCSPYFPHKFLSYGSFKTKKWNFPTFWPLFWAFQPNIKGDMFPSHKHKNTLKKIKYHFGLGFCDPLPPHNQCWKKIFSGWIRPFQVFLIKSLGTCIICILKVRKSARENFKWKIIGGIS